jgi:hypothetical protein
VKDPQSYLAYALALELVGGEQFLRFGARLERELGGLERELGGLERELEGLERELEGLEGLNSD